MSIEYYSKCHKLEDCKAELIRNTKFEFNNIQQYPSSQNLPQVT
jgi:hypothetical protein